MQTRVILGLGGVAGILTLAVTQMGMHSQERQYKKTLQYMHDGRDKIADKMNQLSSSSTPRK